MIVPVAFEQVGWVKLATEITGSALNTKVLLDILFVVVAIHPLASTTFKSNNPELNVEKVVFVCPLISIPAFNHW